MRRAARRPLRPGTGAKAVARLTAGSARWGTRRSTAPGCGAPERRESLPRAVPLAVIRERRRAGDHRPLFDAPDRFGLQR